MAGEEQEGEVADLASLLGPIAADVGGMLLSSCDPRNGGAVHSATASPAPTLPSRGDAAALASPQRSVPSLLDGLAAAQAAAQATAAAQQARQPQQHMAAQQPAAQQQQQQPDAGLAACLLACLWHCAVFRQLVLTWPDVVHKADPVVAALRRSLAAYGTAATAASRAGAAAELSTALGALGAGLPGGGAAGNVLAAMYQRIRQVEAMRGLPGGVDQCFGLALTQGLQCGSCGKVRRRRGVRACVRACVRGVGGGAGQAARRHVTHRAGGLGCLASRTLQPRCRISLPSPRRPPS